MRDVVVADPLAHRFVVDQLHRLRRVRDVESVLADEHPKFYAAGDATGGATVVEAVRDAKRVARALEEAL